MSRRPRTLAVHWIVASLAAQCLAPGADWIRQGVNTNAPTWGIRDGLQFAIHPAGFGGTEGGPRGLIRVGYPTLTNGAVDLVNFIAVEPIVGGRRGFSELERSGLDALPGKRFRAEIAPGILTTNQEVEALEVPVEIEPFDNGARVRLRLQQRSDAPGELRIVIQAAAGSERMDYCILTATMGNKGRTRQLWLRDSQISSLEHYHGFTGTGFAPHRLDPLGRLSRLPNHDVLVAMTQDEANPSGVQPFGRPHFWDYRGRKVTQYWRKPASTVREDLHCAVNGRFTYYGTAQPIPGGVAFENFELRQRFQDGDIFVFGITPQAPSAILLPPPAPRAP